MDTFKLGEVYFRVTYPDRDLLYPGIESFVYIGKNLSDEDVDETLYFQFSSNYGRKGIASQTGTSEDLMICVTSQDALDMLELKSLITELESAASRRALLRSSKKSGQSK